MLPLFGAVALVQLLLWAVLFPQAVPLATRSFSGPEAGADSGPVQPAEAAAAPRAGVSVIVCFHNEAAGIERCLLALAQQRYVGPWEIVAVDDHSTDASANLARTVQRAYPDRIRVVQPPPTRPGKKDALTFGIEQAKYAFLLLTDADCRPASPDWLATMTAPLATGNELVLGVGDYATDTTGLSRWQAFEARYVAIKYLSFAGADWPYMGVGRNLAYRRSFFRRSGGFAAHADLPGGDDDILVSQHARAERTTRVTAEYARTYSRPSPDWRAYFRQRRRHQSAGGYYRWGQQLALGLIGLSHGLFYLLGCCLLFTGWFHFALVIYAVRLLLVVVAHRRLSTAELSFRWWEVALFDAALAPMYLFLWASPAAREQW